MDVQVRQPSRLYLQPIVAGIAGPIGGDILIEKFNSKAPAAIALEYFFRITTATIVSIMAVGNSDFHNPKIFLPLSVALICGFATLTLWNFRDVLTSPHEVPPLLSRRRAVRQRALRPPRSPPPLSGSLVTDPSEPSQKFRSASPVRRELPPSALRS